MKRLLEPCCAREEPLRGRGAPQCPGAAGGVGGGKGKKGSSCEGGDPEQCLKSPRVTHSSDGTRGKYQPMNAALFVIWKSKILVSAARDPRGSRSVDFAPSGNELFSR